MVCAVTDFCNAHTHRKHRQQLFVRNAYHFLKVEHLAQLGYPVSVGVHPWHVHNVNVIEVQQYLIAAAQQPGVVAIGESGLDALAVAPIPVQVNLFQVHILTANKMHLPLIVHCVKCYHYLPSILMQCQCSVVLHAYHGNHALTNTLLKHDNVFFSFGKNLFHRNMVGRQQAILNSIPTHRILLETDNSNISIESVHQAAARMLNKDVDELRTQVAHNFNNVFNKKM